MGKIKIVGLGPGDAGQIGLETFELMQTAKKLILRTEIHPCVAYLKERGLLFTTCDDLYNVEDSFDVLYDKISDRIMDLSKDHDEVIYAVPGHPLVAEKSVQLILEKAQDQVEVEIKTAMSFIDVILSVLKIDPVNGLKILDGLNLEEQKPDTHCGNIITQVYDPYVAAQIKLQLMETYEDEYEIIVIRAAGVPELEKIVKIPLYELDRITWVDYLTSVYIPVVTTKTKKKTLEDLQKVMEQLRGEEGCDWDKKQTTQSLKPYLLEEAYEVIDAIDKDDVELLIEELGDLLLQVVFHAQIGAEDDEFDMSDIVTGIYNKLIVRHPHVFGDVIAEPGEGGALASWEEAKREEKGNRSHTQVLKDIPQALPALMRSYKVQQKAALVGFDWDHVTDAFAKVEEEINELKEVYLQTDKDRIVDELGDLIFAVVNVARFINIQPEFAVNHTIDKFINRFEYIEKKSSEKMKKMEEMTLEEMDILWNEAKK